MTAGDQQRPGERAHLVQRLVHREAAPEADGDAAWASRADLAGLRTALPVRSARIRTQASARPAPPTRGATASAGTHTAVIA